MNGWVKLGRKDVALAPGAAAKRLHRALAGLDCVAAVRSNGGGCALNLGVAAARLCVALIPRLCQSCHRHLHPIIHPFHGADNDKVFDQEAYISESSLFLKISCENYGDDVFPNVRIAGDTTIMYVLHYIGYLKDGKNKVMYLENFHLSSRMMGSMVTTFGRRILNNTIRCARLSPSRGN